MWVTWIPPNHGFGEVRALLNKWVLSTVQDPIRGVLRRERCRRTVREARWDLDRANRMVKVVAAA